MATDPGRWARVRRGVSGGLRVSATALVATAPIAAYHLGQTAPLALLANAIAVPWTAFALLPAALMGAVVAALPPAVPTDLVLAGCERVDPLVGRNTQLDGVELDLHLTANRLGSGVGEILKRVDRGFGVRRARGHADSTSL